MFISQVQTRICPSNSSRIVEPQAPVRVHAVVGSDAVSDTKRGAGRAPRFTWKKPDGPAACSAFGAAWGAGSPP